MTTPTLVSTPPERIHVLQLVDPVDGEAGEGGADSALLQLVERLPRERFRTSAVLPHEGRLADQLRHRGADVVVMAMADDPPWSSIQGAAALVQHGGVDVLHAHRPRAHALAALVGRLTQRPVLATIHAARLTTTDVEAQQSAATHLHLVCRHTYYHALAMGIDARALSCIPHGVDTRAFRPGAERGGALRRLLGLDAAALVVGYIGAGESEPQILARDAHLVRLDEAPLHGDPALLREVDVVVSTSHAEAMPLALLQAMASAVPVLAVRAGGVADLVDHGYSGWLVAAGDVNALAQRLAALLHDPELRRRTGENARERVLERFGLDECVQRTGDLLMRLATRATRQRAAAVPGSVGGPERRGHVITRAG